MQVERRPLSPAERGVLQERLEPSRLQWGEWFCLPTCCGGLAFAIGTLCIGSPLAWLLNREYSTSPLSWAGRGPGYGLMILALLMLLGIFISGRIDEKRLHRRIRKDLAVGVAEVLRARPTAAVVVRPGSATIRRDPVTGTQEPSEEEEDGTARPGARVGASAEGNGDEDEDEDEDDEDEDEAYQLTVYLRIAPTEVLVLEDPDLVDRRQNGFPHLDIEFVWGPGSRVLLGIADEGATLDDVLEVSVGDLPRVVTAQHGELLVYPEPRDTLLALLATDPSERRRLWKQGSTANTLRTRFRLRR